jgi:predicted RNA binding protein YcfA (HicA-like mRNA interferase family)
MPKPGPISRRKLIAYLQDSGFVGPYQGKRHEFMVRGNVRLIIPNPHRGDISEAFLRQILRQAGITRQQWEAL